MPVWLLLSVCALAIVSGGCAGAADERLDRLASEVQAQEVRLAMLEDTVSSLSAPGETHSAATPRKAPPLPAAPQAKPLAGSSPAARQAVTSPAGMGGQAGERIYQKALATLESNRPQAALGLFQEFMRACPGHVLMPNALYWVGECLYSQKQYDAAILTFKDVVAQFPAHPKAAAAMLKVGYSYALLGDIPNARFYLEMLVKDYPASAPAGLARARLATL